MTTAARPRLWTIVGRGWRKRCPHCGEGALFSGFAHHLERCSICGLVYERNPGDTWAFTVLGDRLPIATAIVLVYFGVFRTNRQLGMTLFALAAAVFAWTTPNRWGVGIALHYFSRLLSHDRDDPTPP